MAALALVSPSRLQARGWEDSMLQRVRLPSDMHLSAAGTSANFDEEGDPESLALTGGHVTIRTGSRVRWQSPPAWQVTQAQISDLNHDGRPEAILLVWRPFKPWPVDAWLPHGGRIESFQDSRGSRAISS
jgi:hypothetical protein